VDNLTGDPARSVEVREVVALVSNADEQVQGRAGAGPAMR